MSAKPLPNPKHEAYCLARAGGASQDEAYEAAGFAPNRGNAARLNANESITARILHLQRRVESKVMMSRERAAEILAQIAEDGEQDKDKIAALKLLGDWTGWKAPEKVEHSGSIGFAEQLAVIRSKTKRK